MSTIVVGLGARGRKHAAMVSECRAAHLAGVCDTNPAALDDFPGDLPRDSSYTRLLDRIAPRAAIVVVPHDAYLPIVAECAVRNVACLKEKPMARNLAEALLLRDIVGRHGSPVAIAAQRRHGDVMSALRETLVGEPRPPVAFEYLYTLGRDTVAPGWRASSELAGGGAILDMGYHVVDLLATLFGLPDAVAAYPERPVPAGSTVEVGASLLFRYANGMTGTAMLSRNLGPPTERGAFWLDGRTLQFDGRRLISVDDRGSCELARNQSSREYLHRQLHAFLRLTAGDPGPACGLADALPTMVTIDMCYRALWTGQTVRARDVVDGRSLVGR